MAATKHVDQAGLFAYRPAIDGLRAIAVLAVMLYHGSQLSSSRINVVPGGFLGVDLFFVLSGFLITTLLLIEFRSSHDIRFKSFWLRRARRLLPALILVVTAVAVTFLFRDAFGYGASEVSHFRKDALSSLFYAANWNFAYSGQSYFDQFSGPSPLRHMWSLAIEEQFYLVWPILLYLGLKVLKLSRRTLAIVIMVAAWASTMLMAVMFTPGEDPSRIYYGTDTRAQAMLVGAFVAFVLIGVPREKLRSPLVQWGGIIGLAGCFVMFRIATDDAERSPWMYTGGFLLMAVLAALAIISASGPQDTPLAKVLAWKPLVWIGTLSYGLYLWHWPVFVVIDSELTKLGGPALLALRFAFTFAIAVLSYRFVEAPIRFGALRERRARTITLAGVGLATLLLVLSVAVVKPGSDELAALGDEDVAAANVGNLPEVKPGDGKVLLVGDSVAQSLGFYRGLTPGYAVKTGAIIGCGVARGKLAFQDGTTSPDKKLCDTWPKTWKDMVNAFDPDVSVLMIGAWEIFDHEVDGKVLRVGTDEYEEYLDQELEQGLQILTAKGSPVVMTTAGCMKVLKPGTQSDWPERNDLDRVNWVNGVIQRFAQRHPNRVKVVDLHGFLCPEGTFVGEVEGVKYTDDGTHFNKQGGAVVWQWLATQLQQYRPKQ